jgi:hypothetical protein
MLPHKAAGTVITVLSLCIIAALTLTPDPSAGHQPLSLCITCGALGGVDFVLNTLLFIPLGVGLRLRGGSPRRAWLFALALTICIEALQIRVIAGRDASLGDVFSNALGAFVGIQLVDCWRALLFPRAARATRFAVAGAVIWFGAIALGGWAVTPSIDAGPYHALWAPDLYQIELFEGHVLDVRLNGAPLERGELVRNTAMRIGRRSRDSLRIDARIAPAGETFDLAPIVSIASHDDSMLVVLGQDGSDVAFRVRLNAGILRLRMPMVAGRWAIPARSDATGTGDTILISGTIRDGRLLRAESRVRGAIASAEIALDPFLLWDALAPTRHLRPRTMAALSLFWVAIIVAPLGYWSGRSCAQRARRGVRATETVGGVVAAVVLGLAVLPPLFGFPVAHASTWLAAIASALVFAALGSWTSADRRGGEEIEREVGEGNRDRNDAAKERAHGYAAERAEKGGERTR